MVTNFNFLRLGVMGVKKGAEGGREKKRNKDLGF